MKRPLKEKEISSSRLRQRRRAASPRPFWGGAARCRITLADLDRGGDDRFSFFEVRGIDGARGVGQDEAVVEALFQPFPMLPGRRAQVWRHQPSFRRPRHFHAEPEINLVLRGRANMGVGAGEIEMGPGDLIFLSPAQDHVMLDASADLELFVVAIRRELADRLAVDGIAARPDKLTLDAPRCERISAELFGLADVVEGAVQERRVCELFESALRMDPRGDSASRRGLRRLYGDSALKAHRVADEIGIHASELSRRFFGDVGVRFVDARARLRLIGFVASVDHGSSLTAAALEHFGSYAQCHRVFRRFLGCSPRDYFAGTRDSTDDARFE